LKISIVDRNERSGGAALHEAVPESGCRSASSRATSRGNHAGKSGTRSQRERGRTLFISCKRPRHLLCSSVTGESWYGRAAYRIPVGRPHRQEEPRWCQLPPHSLARSRSRSLAGRQPAFEDKRPAADGSTSWWLAFQAAPASRRFANIPLPMASIASAWKKATTCAGCGWPVSGRTALLIASLQGHDDHFRPDLMRTCAQLGPHGRGLCGPWPWRPGGPAGQHGCAATTELADQTRHRFRFAEAAASMPPKREKRQRGGLPPAKPLGAFWLSGAGAPAQGQRPWQAGACEPVPLHLARRPGTGTTAPVRHSSVPLVRPPAARALVLRLVAEQRRLSRARVPRSGELRSADQ